MIVHCSFARCKSTRIISHDQLPRNVYMQRHEFHRPVIDDFSGQAHARRIPCTRLVRALKLDDALAIAQIQRSLHLHRVVQPVGVHAQSVCRDNHDPCTSARYVCEVGPRLSAASIAHRNVQLQVQRKSGQEAARVRDHFKILESQYSRDYSQVQFPRVTRAARRPPPHSAASTRCRSTSYGGDWDGIGWLQKMISGSANP